MDASRPHRGTREYAKLGIGCSLASAAGQSQHFVSHERLNPFYVLKWFENKYKCHNWPGELIQDKVRGSSRQADNVVCQPYVTGYTYLRLGANVGAAAGLNTPANGQENPISCQCQGIKAWQCPWWGKSSPWLSLKTTVTLQIVRN